MRNFRTSGVKDKLNEVRNKSGFAKKAAMESKQNLFAFQWHFRNSRRLQAMIKTLDGMCLHSDTALLKVRQRNGIYISLTDPMLYCCLEARIRPNKDMSVHVKEFSAKIRLPALTECLRAAHRIKRPAGSAPPQIRATIFARGRDPIGSIFVRNSNGNEQQVTSVEGRARCYYILSTRRFRMKHRKRMGCFKIDNTALKSLIAQLCIISGTRGGVSSLKIEAVEDDPSSSRPKKAGTLTWTVTTSMGGEATISCHSHKASKSLPISVTPSKPLSVRFFLAYLKSSSALFVPSDQTTFMVAKSGILLSTEMRDDLQTVIWVRAIDKKTDLNAFC